MATATINSPVLYVIDFDSTFTKVEGLDELAAIALSGHPNKDSIVGQIRDLTDQGMNGEIPFSEGLRKRIELLSGNRQHIAQLVEYLKTQISNSFQRNKKFFANHQDQIYIISSGFKEYIIPVVSTLGVLPEHVLANEFRFDEDGNIIGIDESNPLASDGGKIKALQSLGLDAEVYVIGDGYTDYELKESGLASRFYAFTENVKRDRVLSVADHVVASLDEFLYHNKLDRSQSYPTSLLKVLLLENVHPSAVKAFEKDGFQVEFLKGALDEDELCEKIKDVAIIGIRSKTQITRRVLENANRLMAIGAFCIGTNQIDLEAATEKGIPVFNAPYSNTRSVVELAIGQIIMLARNIFPKSIKMHRGEWDKSAAGSFEVRGKKLGLVGYGSIGSQLSIVAEAMGMEVYFYDTIEKLALGNAKKVDTLEELLSISDFISLHVDGRKSNSNLIGKREFDLMKDGVIFLNLSRGHVVDIPSLAEAIKSGKVAGAAIDVFPQEPKTNSEPFVSELIGLPNVILTPHIGGSTREAQENIGKFVPSKLLEYMNNGSTYGSVNFPEVQLPKLKNSHRILHIHANVPGMLAKLNHIFGKNHINITGQYLKTNETVGYVIVDIAKGYNREFIKEVKAIEGTIRFRMLY